MAKRTKQLAHIDAKGEARMVDVSAKPDTERVAVAEGQVIMTRKTLDLIAKGNAAKGDVLGTARIAGTMAAKRSSELIPLCHPLAISGVTVELAVADDAVEIHATVRTTDRTGVEMEALTAVSVAALTVIDMVKAVDKGATITDVRVETKSGGKSEEWHR